jgi:dihydroorotate dehydrogenase (fumarate)
MDLSTTYLGFELPHPLIPGASPLADDLDAVRQLEDAGAPLIQMSSLFEEEIQRENTMMDDVLAQTTNVFAEALDFMPQPDAMIVGPDEYLEKVRRVKQAVGVPVIASLNGNTVGGWMHHACAIEQAGADALELNLYRVATDLDTTAADVESEDIAMVSQLCSELNIPLAVKLSSFYSSLPHFVAAVAEAGAGSVVLFNRFYQPDIDVEELELERKLKLSTPDELNVRLRWLAILAGRVPCDLAVTGGVHSAIDALKAVMCGASACQMVSALLMHGPAHLARVREELARWLESHEYESLAQARGSMSLQRSPDPHIYERANYLHILRSWEDSRTARKALGS